MSDFETHPVGTTEHIKKLEAHIARWNDRGQVAMTIIGESNPLPDTPIQLAGEILSDMLTEDRDSLPALSGEASCFIAVARMS
jgi:hypothetical protein